MASSSIAGVFPPTHFRGNYYMDGGMGPWGMNVDSAVEQCIYELGYDMSNYTNEVLEKIELDVLICYNWTRPESEVHHRARKNYQVEKSLKRYWSTNINVEKEIGSYEGVTMNYYFKMGRECPYSALDFDAEHTWCFQEQGRADAQ